MKNIFYFYNINAIGGIESWFYYLAKKYKDNDITIYYQIGDEAQIRRLKQYVRVRRYTGQKLQCEKAFFCFNTDIIDNVEANEYIQVMHGDYKTAKMKINTHPKITKYLGVSETVCNSFKELMQKDIELCYNPIEIDKPRKVLNLISATRLTSEKGKSRIIKLAKILDESGIPYIWTIFTNDTNAIDNPNIRYMKPRLNIIDYIANSDYLVQLSDNEGYCYSIVESLCVGTPVIATNCPVFTELGLVNGVNGFILDFDLKEVPIKEIYKGLPKFTYKPKEDSWNNYLAKGKSTYQKDLKTMVKVQCIAKYTDIQLGVTKEIGDLYKINKIRAEELTELGFVKEVE